MNEEITTKKCRQCHIEKELKYFGSKHEAICKPCKKLSREAELKNMLSQGVIPEKICLCCGLKKTYLFFNKNLRLSYGISSRCIDCERINQKEKFKKISEINKNIIVTHIECKSCLQVKPVASFTKKSCVKRGFKSNCKDCDRAEPKTQLEEKLCHKCDEIKPISNFGNSFSTSDGLDTTCKACRRQCDRKNKDAINKARSEKRKNNRNFKLACDFRSAIKRGLKNQGVKKSLKSQILLGCSTEDFEKHLESLFEPGMTWQNNTKNGWHIDHIIPCASFDLTQESEQLKCFHWSNQMPRWATTAIAKAHGSNQIGNLNKGSKIINGPVSLDPPSHKYVYSLKPTECLTSTISSF